MTLFGGVSTNIFNTGAGLGSALGGAAFPAALIGGGLSLASFINSLYDKAALERANTNLSDFRQAGTQFYNTEIPTNRNDLIDYMTQAKLALSSIASNQTNRDAYGHYAGDVQADSYTNQLLKNMADSINVARYQSGQGVRNLTTHMGDLSQYSLGEIQEKYAALNKNMPSNDEIMKILKVGAGLQDSIGNKLVPTVNGGIYTKPLNVDDMAYNPYLDAIGLNSAGQLKGSATVNTAPAPINNNTPEQNTMSYLTNWASGYGNNGLNGTPYSPNDYLKAMTQRDALKSYLDNYKAPTPLIPAKVATNTIPGSTSTNAIPGEVETNTIPGGVNKDIPPQPTNWDTILNSLMKNTNTVNNNTTYTQDNNYPLIPFSMVKVPILQSLFR